MQTIIILLNPGKLTNPNTDLCYHVPDRIEQVFDGLIQSSGYDFIDAEEGQSGPLLCIWLQTQNARRNWKMIQDLFEKETFDDNSLSACVEIYISENDSDSIENCTRVFPES